jgi:hypothetical protein
MLATRGDVLVTAEGKEYVENAVAAVRLDAGDAVDELKVL